MEPLDELGNHAPVQPHGEAAQQVGDRDDEVAYRDGSTRVFPELLVIRVPVGQAAAHALVRSIDVSSIALS